MTSPDTDFASPHVQRRADDNEPFCALAFKLMSDKHVGHLTYIRVYSGHAASGTQVQNANRGRKQRIGRLLQMHANKRKEIPEVFAGEIAAVVGLKQIATGGDKPQVTSGLDFYDTGVALVTDKAAAGVTSIDSTEGAKLCWGTV